MRLGEPPGGPCAVHLALILPRLVCSEQRHLVRHFVAEGRPRRLWWGNAHTSRMNGPTVNGPTVNGSTGVSLDARHVATPPSYMCLLTLLMMAWGWHGDGVATACRWIALYGIAAARQTHGFDVVWMRRLNGTGMPMITSRSRHGRERTTSPAPRRACQRARGKASARATSPPLW